MRKLFCFNKKDLVLSDVADHLEKNLGLILRGKPKSKEIHGVLYGNHFPAGYKESIAYNKGRYWCNESLTEEEHSCVVLVLYEDIKNIGGILMPTGQFSSEITHKNHPKVHEIHKDISNHVSKFAEQKGLKVCHHEVTDEVDKHLDFFVALKK